MRGTLPIQGEPIAFESSLERDFLQLVAFDRAVTSVCGQPVRIAYKDRSGRGRSYTPDFLLLYSEAVPGARGLLVEVKYRADLFAAWPTIKPKLKAARAFAKSEGLRFLLMTENEIRGPQLANVRIVDHHRKLAPNPGIEEKLASTLVLMGEAPIAALLERAWHDAERRLAGYAYVLRMIGRGRIGADLSVPLTRNTTVWITAGEGFRCDPHSYRSNLV